MCSEVLSDYRIASKISPFASWKDAALHLPTLMYTPYVQTCRQLFKELHPPRLACPAPPDPASLLPLPTSAGSNTTGTALSLALLTTILAATASEGPPTAASAEVT